MICVAVAALSAPARAQWPASRGNVGRTGNVDGRAGPKVPKILWAQRSQAHFIASPVPDGGRLYLAALGAFNTGVLHALATAPRAAERTVWSKAAPYVRRPTVCAPVVPVSSDTHDDSTIAAVISRLTTNHAYFLIWVPPSF